MTDLPTAPDINDVAWDPLRDSAAERRSLLRELDPLPLDQAWATFVPERRTRAGLPLGVRARLLLLGSTAQDLEVVANEANLGADVDDDDEAEVLREAIETYEALLGNYRLLRRDSDERTLARMPVAQRRQARQLQNRIRELQASRCDGATRRLRTAQAALHRWGLYKTGSVDTPQRSSRIASFVLPLDGERVLLARHTYGPPVWALLGGMALPDEAPDVTAHREFEEESGLRVAIGRLVAVCDIGDLLTFIFGGKVIDGVEHPQQDEIAELRWFSQAELDDTPVFQVVPLLLKALAGSPAGAQDPPGLSSHMVAWPDGTPHPVYLVS